MWGRDDEEHSGLSAVQISINYGNVLMNKILQWLGLFGIEAEMGEEREIFIRRYDLGFCFSKK